MTRILALLPLAVELAIAGCASSTPRLDNGPAPDASSTALRVMSFNVRLDVASDSANAWPYRIDAVAEIVRDADVVGV